MILGCVTCLQGWKLPAGGAGDVVGHCQPPVHSGAEFGNYTYRTSLSLTDELSEREEAQTA